MKSVTKRSPAGLVRRTRAGRLAVLGVVSFLVTMLGTPGLAFSSPATTPNPGGTASGDRSELRRIACPSSTRCWAVGDYKPSGGAQLNQILRWNGTAWSQATTPNPGGTTTGSQNQLLGVYCTST